MTAVLEAIGYGKRSRGHNIRGRDAGTRSQALQGPIWHCTSGQTLGMVGESKRKIHFWGDIYDLQKPTSGIMGYSGQDIRSLGEKGVPALSPQCAILYFPKSQRIHEPLLYCERILCRAYEDPMDVFNPHKAR